MAQHIPINKFKQKKFKAIEQAIKKAFNGSPYGIPFLTSMKYIYDSAISDHLKANDDELVYMTQYHIGKGFVFGTETGDFEIHFNKITKLISNIYLVA